MKSNFVHRCLAITTGAAMLALHLAAAQALSVEASMLSTPPVAVSGAAPVLLSAGAALTVVAVLVTVMSTGWLLSVAGTAIAFIPNEIGAALLYNERVTR